MLSPEAVVTLKHTALNAVLSNIPLNCSLDIVTDTLNQISIHHGIDIEAIEHALFNFEISGVFSPVKIAQASLESLTLSLNGKRYTCNTESLHELLTPLMKTSKLLEKCTNTINSEKFDSTDMRTFFVKKGQTVIELEKIIHVTSIYGKSEISNEIHNWISYDDSFYVSETSTSITLTAKIDGYLTANDRNTFSLESPLTINNDSTILSFVCLPSQNNIHIIDSLSLEVGSYDDHIIDHTSIKQIEHDIIKNIPGRYIIKQGRSAVPGADSILKMLVVKKYLPDEQTISLDYKEISPYQSIEKGTIIAEIIQGATAKTGIDIYGNDIKPEHLSEPIFKTNQNIRVEKHDNTTHYIADITGILKLSAESASIYDALIINGDVTQTTGNIEHTDNIIVRGSLCAGFSITTPASVLIEGNIERGTAVKCVNLTVQGGILGTFSKYQISGNVDTSFIQNSILRISGELKVYKYIYNSEIFVRKDIIVRGYGTHGSNKGCIIGGTLNSLNSITIHSTGSPFEKTTIISGIDIMLLAQYNLLTTALQAQQIKISNLQSQTNINFSALNNNQITKLSEERKTNLKTTLLELRMLLIEKKELENKRKLINQHSISTQYGNTRIIILNHIIPDTIIQIGRIKTTVLNPQYNKMYYLNNGRIFSDPL